MRVIGMPDHVVWAPGWHGASSSAFAPAPDVKRYLAMRRM